MKIPVRIVVLVTILITLATVCGGQKSWTYLKVNNAPLQLNGEVSCLINVKGQIIAGGNYTNSGGRYVARWNDTQWIQIDSSSTTLKAQSIITSLASDKYGNIY